MNKRNVKTYRVSEKKVLFIGGTRRGYLVLKSLIDKGFNVTGIISLRQEAHESDRYEGPIKELSIKHGIKFSETKWMKDRDYATWISKEIRPDLALVVGCRIIIPKSIYTLPPLGSFAVHDSFLPTYRGFAPLNWVIINGEKTTGVSLFRLSENMDEGPWLLKKKIVVGLDESAPELYKRVCQVSVDLVVQFLTAVKKNKKLDGYQQNHAGATYAVSRLPDDGLIDWSESTLNIYRLIRGLTYPYPGAFSYYRGEKIFIWVAKPQRGIKVAGRIPGRILNRSEKDGFVDVLTGDGILRIYTAQMQGESKQKWAADLIRSVRDTLGLGIPELIRRIKQLEVLLKEN